MAVVAEHSGKGKKKKTNTTIKKHPCWYPKSAAIQKILTIGIFLLLFPI